MEYKGLKFNLLNHDSVRISSDDQTIYIDPFGLPEDNPVADVIFISHPHDDHCSPDDLRKISSEKTIIVAAPDCEEKIADINCSEKLFVRPEQEIAVNDLKVNTVRAYNIGKKFHPKSNDWLGYILTIKDCIVYFAGDTDLIPEMNVFPDIDVAFLPCSGTYVMTAEEAANATIVIQPEISVPMHYGSIIGSLDDAKAFKKLVEFHGLRVEILNE